VLQKPEPDFRTMSEAVQAWHRHYGIIPNEQSTSVLCLAAIELYNEGYRSLDEIAAMLISTYVGQEATRVNAPTSAAVH
jgi:divalent metal cation (Fe/Co/Zn/Cd) transporter